MASNITSKTMKSQRFSVAPFSRVTLESGICEDAVVINIEETVKQLDREYKDNVTIEITDNGVLPIIKNGYPLIKPFGQFSRSFYSRPLLNTTIIDTDDTLLLTN